MLRGGQMLLYDLIRTSSGSPATFDATRAQNMCFGKHCGWDHHLEDDDGFYRVGDFATETSADLQWGEVYNIFYGALKKIVRRKISFFIFLKNLSVFFWGWGEKRH